MVAIGNSILDSVKKNLGLGVDYDVFDHDIMTHINATFMNLQQLGIGPTEGFVIENAETTWDAFLGAQASPLLNSVKAYMQFKVRLAFDPPGASFHIASLEKQIQELEWRMLIVREELLDISAGVSVPDLPPADPE